MILNFDTGRFSNQEPQSRRTLRDLQGIFENPVDEVDRLVYEVHGCPSEVEGPARLLYATTILYPGDVQGEYFMTRGHFHTDPNRGELVFTLKGSGLLVLMDRNRETWTEAMSLGSTHDIDGRHAHRVVNTGHEPLIFLVAWMSDCGHDYESIRERGFGKRFHKD